MKFATIISVTAALLGSAAILPAQSTDDDAGKKAFQKVCFDCHGMDMIQGEGLSKDGWRETVQEMVGRGARATDDEIDLIVNYLADHYPPPKINVNTESAGDLQLDLEISFKEAKSIVQYREAHGKFKTLDELEKVPDVDIAKIEAKKDRVVF